MVVGDSKGAVSVGLMVFMVVVVGTVVVVVGDSTGSASLIVVVGAVVVVDSVGLRVLVDVVVGDSAGSASLIVVVGAVVVERVRVVDKVGDVSIGLVMVDGLMVVGVVGVKVRVGVVGEIDFVGSTVGLVIGPIFVGAIVGDSFRTGSA